MTTLAAVRGFQSWLETPPKYTLCAERRREFEGLLLFVGHIKVFNAAEFRMYEMDFYVSRPKKAGWNPMLYLFRDNLSYGSMAYAIEPASHWGEHYRFGITFVKAYLTNSWWQILSHYGTVTT